MAFTPNAPIFRPGPEDFRRLREEGYAYVDKTAFIEEWLRAGDPVVLIPRPRRFGKTLNLSMLRCWLEPGDGDREALFEGLDISRAGPEIQRHRGQYPVILISLKDTRADSFEGFLGRLRGVLHDLLSWHRELADSPALTEEQHRLFRTLFDGRADTAGLALALRHLSRWLELHHGRSVVLLVDEYDAPIEAGFQHGYYDAIVEFMRGLLGAALKSNPSLFRGVLTGVRRLSKESLFSDLNNVTTRTVLDPTFATSFGFTEPEVAGLLEAAGRGDRLADVRTWYNGYQFGGQVIYNPWSVLCFAERGELLDYWAQTSSDALLRALLVRGVEHRDDLETLLLGGRIEKRLDDQVSLRDLDRAPGSLWALLWSAGYLRATSLRYVDGEARVELDIPNVEVGHVWRRSFADWLELRLGSDAAVSALQRAILGGDAETVEGLLGRMVANALSAHDTGVGPDDAPERVYQAFVLGLLVSLEPEYRVVSNREAGFGRADVLILPRRPGRPGVALELRRLRADRGEAPEAALDAAHAQITGRGYLRELEAVGASPARALAVVFSGKRVWVR